MSRKMHTILVAGCLALASSAMLPTIAAADSDKGLQASRPGAAPVAVTSLGFDMQAIKAGYDVGEPVRLRVRGTQPFFLTVFSEDLDTGQVTTLIPSPAQRNNKYPAGRYYTVPNPGVTFTADRPGRVRLTAVASTRSIDFDVSKFKADGDFYTTTADELYGQFESKGMRVRQARRPSAPQPLTTSAPVSAPTAVSGASFVVQTADITINPTSTGFASPYASQSGDTDATGIVLLSGDRDAYRIGERARFVFGADRPGTVTLYVIEPGGSYGELLSREVEANSLQSIEAMVEAPVGAHTVLAVFDDKAEQASVQSDVVSQILRASGGRKGLSLINDGQSASTVPPHAIFEFRVVR